MTNSIPLYFASLTYQIFMGHEFLSLIIALCRANIKTKTCPNFEMFEDRILFIRHIMPFMHMFYMSTGWILLLLLVALAFSRLLRLLDRRYRGIAHGVGQSEILGRIHVAPIKVMYILILFQRGWWMYPSVV